MMVSLPWPRYLCAVLQVVQENLQRPPIVCDPQPGCVRHHQPTVIPDDVSVIMAGDPW